MVESSSYSLERGRVGEREGGRGERGDGEKGRERGRERGRVGRERGDRGRERERSRKYMYRKYYSQCPQIKLI